MSNTGSIVIWILEISAVAAINLAMPSMTRPDIFFSVLVNPGFRATPEANSITSGYRWRVIAATLCAFAVVIAARGNQVAGCAAMLLLIGGSMTALIQARRQARAFATKPPSVREAALSKPPSILPIALIVAIPLLVLSGALCWANLNLTSMPEPLPVHWGISGEPNGWMSRTRFNVNAFFASMIWTCALLGASAAAIKLGARRIRVAGKSNTAERIFFAGTILVLIAFEYLSAGIALLPFGFPALPIVIGFLTIGSGGTASLIIMGQGGSRVAEDAAQGPIGDRTDDANWKWGIFYVNPDDSALIVEKRFGIGYTLNFGHRGSWIGIAAICVGLLITGILPARQLFETKAASMAGGQLADQLLAALKANDFNRAERDFSSMMKDKLPPGKLAQVWAETTGPLGGLEIWKLADSQRHGGLEARNYDASFTRGRMRVLVGVDLVNDQVVGLWFLDPRSENAKE